MTRNVVLSVALVIATMGCADAPEMLAPSKAAVALHDTPLGASVNGHLVDAAGEFEAVVDFSTLTLTPRGQNCLLQVSGQLVFSGTIEGVGTGTTTALVLATCEEVASAPPGTHRDVFHSELTFEGTIGGTPAQAAMIYQGRVREGGQIEGRILASKGVAGVLAVDAIVAVGGSYSGSIVVH